MTCWHYSCLHIAMSEDELRSFFDKHRIKAIINNHQVLKRTLYYATIGEDYLPAILFIHGAPASMTIYKDFFTDEELLKRFCMYAVDRAGFGVTDGRTEPFIKKQAEMIFPLAERIQRVHQPLIIMAGSYGVPIACRLVIDHPNVVQGLVLVAPSLGPGLEKMYWITPLLAKGFLSKVVSKEYKSASIEKMHHKKELEKMLPLWNKIDVPVFYLQSKNDSVVYPSNAEFAKQHLTGTPYLKIHFFKGRKHDIDSKHHLEIRNKLLELFKMLMK
ncbi:MAG TPA: alpha/beta hydrolase [Flavisolibacter sp.]|nr:alpha/beta hydrolase [Flavisolibacter sp.]